MSKFKILIALFFVLPIFLEAHVYGIDNGVILDQQRQNAENPVSAVFDRWNSSSKEVSERAKRQSFKEKNSVVLTCFLDAADTALPCPNVTFIVRNSRQIETQRARTDDQGSCILPLADDVNYSLVPASKHYRLEPSGEVHIKRGDRVTIHLHVQ